MAKAKFSSIVGQSLSTTLIKYVSIFLEEIGLDLSFQSLQRWGKEQSMKFINSCLLDMNINKFILVDCESCRAQFPKGSEDYNYFNNWIENEGIRYLNVDSNNRNVTLKEFLADNIQIFSGDYVIDDIAYTVTKDKNDKFSTMDEDLKVKLLGSRVSFYMITKSNRKQLSDVFERMNSGLPLNFFERINCSYSDTCRYIRELSIKHSDKLIESPMFSLTDKNRRIIDGFLAHVFYLNIKGINKPFTKNTHTKWYNDATADGVVAKFFKDFTSYMKLMGDKTKLIKHKFVFFDLFWLMQEQKKQSKVLNKEMNIVQDFIDTYTKLVNDKVMYSFWYAKGKGKEGVLPPPKWQEEHGLFPFKHFAKGEGTMTPTRHKLYKDKGFKIEDYFISVDPKRTVDRLEKQGLAVESGWKDADGDEIIPEELHDGDYDAGHIVAHAKGGKTEPDNMVIEKMSPNRSKQMEETVVKS